LAPDETAQPKKAKGGFRAKLGAPAKLTAEDLIRAIQNVNDKGGRAKLGDLVELFGGEKRREFLSRSLTFAFDLGFLTKDGASFVLEQGGKQLLGANEDDRKVALGAKLVTYQPYRDVLLRLRDEKERQLKKKTLTEAWSNIAGGGGRDIRQEMTKTFASLAEYAGLVEDSGMTITLKEEGLRLVETGTERHAPSPQKVVQGAFGLVPPQGPVLTVAFVCPRCGGTDIGILDEELVQSFSVNSGNVVLIKYKLLCRACKENFARLGQQSISGTVGA